MSATKVLEAQHEFPEGDRWEAVTWAVPKSDAYPEGLKYRFQYLGPDDGQLLRYDNSHDEPGVGRHHRHRRGSVQGITFDGLRAHFEQFREEVDTIHDRRFG